MNVRIRFRIPATGPVRRVRAFFRDRFCSDGRRHLYAVIAAPDRIFLRCCVCDHEHSNGGIRIGAVPLGGPR